jgi:hypothetical protein
MHALKQLSGMLVAPEGMAISVKPQPQNAPVGNPVILEEKVSTFLTV